jgi:protein MBA1
MAHLLRQPLSKGIGAALTLPKQPNPIRVPSQCRSFSQTSISQAKERPQQFVTPYRKAERDIRLVSKQQQQQNSALPRDIGLLPGKLPAPFSSYRNILILSLPATYIHPHLSRLPKNPLYHLSLNYKRLKFRLRDVAYRIMIKLTGPRIGAGKRFWQIGKAKMQNPSHSELKANALRLYSEMYNAFAAGDTTTLRKICGDSMYIEMATRIAARGREKAQWEMTGMKKARVVSNRAVRLPGEGNAWRQAVVRIESSQRLWRIREDGKLRGGKEKNVTEWFVIQKSVRGWEEGKSWDVFGMVQPTEPKLEFKRWAEEGVM